MGSAISGPSFGAAGAHELKYSILMLGSDFIVANANINNISTELTGLPIVCKNMYNVDLKTTLSNSLGFGGVNTSVVVKKYEQ